MTLSVQFNTLAEDGSVEEVSALLLAIRAECAVGNFACVPLTTSVHKLTVSPMTQDGQWRHSESDGGEPGRES